MKQSWALKDVLGEMLYSLSDNGDPPLNYLEALRVVLAEAPKELLERRVVNQYPEVGDGNQSISG